MTSQDTRRDGDSPIDLLSATTLVAASMIGVGVYTTSGYALAALGTPQRVLLAWLIGGLIAVCGAIGYGALATRFTESGGEYMFLARSLHPVAGLMAGWVSLLAGFTGAIAIAAIGLEQYLSPISSTWIAVPQPTIAIVVILIAAALHSVTVRWAARIQDAVIVVKLMMIATFVLLALWNLDRWQGWPSVSETTAPPWDLSTFVGQLVWISFSYLGFNAAVYIAGEVRQPERNVPRALVGGTLAVTVIYLMLNAIFVLAPPASAVTAEDQIAQVAATAAQSIGGSRFSLLVRLVIVMSLFTSISALVMTGPRVYAKMAEDGFFPRWLCFSERPPLAAIWMQAVLGVLAVSISTLPSLLGYLSLTLSLCSALTIAMLFVLRMRGQITRLPWRGVPPAIYVVATVVLATIYGIDRPIQAAAAVGTICFGIAVYPWVSRRLAELDESSAST